MDVYIECPICEEKFYSPDDGPGSPIQCPGCGRQFALTPEVRIEAPLLKPDSQPSSSSVNSRLARQATFAKPGAAAPEEFDESLPGIHPAEQIIEPDVPIANTKLGGTAEIRHRYQRRNKRKLVVTLVTGGILAAIIGVLSGLLVMQLQKRSHAAKNGGDEAVIDPENPSTEADGINGNESSDAGNTEPSATPSDDTPSNNSRRAKTEKPIRLSDLPPQELEFLSQAQMDECWETVQPHLVGLQITNSRGKHLATGTIVDSRGWILTSYSAIQGASKIEVSASAKSIDNLPDENLLTDLVRGVVALDMENDLALLSINRRFVISFVDIKLAESNKVVEGEYLVQCAPPSKKNPFARTESKILIRDQLESLQPSGQDEAKRRKLADPSMMWIVATNDTTPLPGTPLVRPDGTVAGFSVFAQKDTGYFLPVDQVKPLIDSATDDIAPLTVLGGSTRDNGPTVNIAESHPMRDASERLNSLGDACQEFGWIPKNESQYNDLQNFTEQVANSLIYVMENEDNQDENVEQIQTLVMQWENTLTERMSSLKSDDYVALREMNKFAKKELRKPRRFIPFFGEVYIGGIDLPDKLILKFNADQTYVNIPFVPSDDDPMLPESQWLFFIKTPAASRTVNFKIANDPKPIPTFSADLQFAIGPTK